MGINTGSIINNTNIIHQGDALTVLKTLPSESVDMCMTSPPYWALRDYGVAGQLGLEPTFQSYIDKLVGVFDEVKRVLKKEGSCWVVMGDTYNAGRNGGHAGGVNTAFESRKEKLETEQYIQQSGVNAKDIPSKSLCMIPERFAIAMIDHGWILRNKIVWHKRNCMPSSAKDRFTVDYETLFFFVKQQQYYFETQYDPYTRSPHAPKNKKNVIPLNTSLDNPQRIWGSEMGRIKRSVWTINPKPFSEAHFAVYPEKLCETPIKAGCPEFVCRKCGKARETIYEEKRINTRPGLDIGNGKSGTNQDPNSSLHISDLSKYRQNIIRYNPKLSDCGCNDFYCYNCKQFINPQTLRDMFALQRQKETQTISNSVGNIQVSETETTGKIMEGDNEVYREKLCKLWQDILSKEETTMLFKKMWDSKTSEGWNTSFFSESKSREVVGMERGQDSDAGLCDSVSTKPSICDETRLCNGTSTSDGEVSRKISTTKRKCASQERDQRRQQDRKSGIGGSQQSLWIRVMSILSEEFHGKIKCPFCLSENIQNKRYGFDSGVVLDCFMGSGTTGLVALKLARRFIGIELNEEYIKIAKKRLDPYLLQEKITNQII